MAEKVPAPFDAYLNTPNKSVRQNVPRKGVVLHGAVTSSLSALESMTMGGKQVSATAIAKDSISKQLMTDPYRPWSLSSAWGDSTFRSCETCNEPDLWNFSDATVWELARMVAFWAQRDGFWPHRSGPKTTWTVLGHREVYEIYDVSYATACPQGMPLDLVTARAQDILRAAAAGSEDDESEEDEMKNSAYIYTRAKDKKSVVFLFNTGSGWWMEYISSASIVPKGNNAIAATLGTGSYAWVSEALVEATKSSMVRAQGVDLNDADVKALAAAMVASKDDADQPAA